jgi:hypothetical protein
MAAAGPYDAQKAADDVAVEEMRQQFGDQEAARLAADLYKLRRSSGGNLWGVMPRWVVLVAAVWLAVLETASRLPDLLLTYPKYQADKAEFQAKILQPDLMAAQLEKAKLEAQAAAFQPALTAAQAFQTEIDDDVKGSSADGSTGARLENMFDLVNPMHPFLVQRGLSNPNVFALLKYINKPLTSLTPAPASSPASDPAPTPQAVTPALRPETAAPVAAPDQPHKSQAYQDGARDRSDWESWFASVTGDEHEGADYWSGVRNTPGDHACTDGKGATSADFQKGCNEARDKLTPIDARRRAELDYKAGFNAR